MKARVKGRDRRLLLLLAPLLLGAVVLPAGRSGAAEEPKALTVSPTTVVEGLKTIQRAGEEVAKLAAEDKAEAEKAAHAITPVWSMIEGTLRANDQNAYTTLERTIEDLAAAARAGDGKQADTAIKELRSAVQAYVNQHPAGAPAPSGRTAAAASKPKADTPARASASAKPAPAAGERTAAANTGAGAGAGVQAGNPALARTGPSSALTALAGAAFGLGGLAFIGGARRRRS